MAQPPNSALFFPDSATTPRILNAVGALWNKVLPLLVPPVNNFLVHRFCDFGVKTFFHSSPTLFVDKILLHSWISFLKLRVPTILNHLLSDTRSSGPGAVSAVTYPLSLSLCVSLNRKPALFRSLRIYIYNVAPTLPHFYSFSLKKKFASIASEHSARVWQERFIAPPTPRGTLRFLQFRSQFWFFFGSITDRERRGPRDSGERGERKKKRCFFFSFIVKITCLPLARDWDLRDLGI